MTGLLLLVGLILTIGTYAMYFGAINVLKCLVLSITTYFFEYVLVCAALFCFDSFELIYALLIILLINSVILIFGYIKGKRPEIIFDYKKYLIPILISACILPFTINKFGFFGMGQDQGVYQTQAISMIYGDTNLQMDFEEYHVLSDEDKAVFEKKINHVVVGLYRYYSENIDLPMRNIENRLSEVSSEYHGIPTFAAILALWGTIFGIGNMSGIHTIFLICTIFLVYFIAENLKLKKSSKILATLMTAFSPIILWVSKSSLTEMFLTVIICCFIYYITESEDKKSIYLSALPVIVFSFYHIAIYTIIPIFVLLYFVLYFYKGNKAYIDSAIAILIGFFAGMIFMTYVSATYAYGNFQPLFSILPCVNSNNVLLFLFIVSALGIGMGLVVKSNTILFAIQKISNQTIYVWTIRIVSVGCYLYQLKILYSMSKEYGSIIEALHHMTFIGYIMITGMIVLPVVCYKIVRKPILIMAHQNTLIIGILFIYCILIHSSVLRQEIPYYYYYGRYLAPFVPIVALLGAIYLNPIADKVNYIIAAMSFLILLPFNQIHIEGIDDTRLDWSVLEDFELFLTEKDAVIIESDELMRCLYLPIRSMTGAKVFMVFDRTSIDGQIDKLDELYDNVYYIGNNTNMAVEDMKIAYYNRYEKSEDKAEYISNISPFPLDYTTSVEQIICYKKQQPTEIIDVSDDEHEISGLNPDTSDPGFRWSYDERVYIPCLLIQTDYIFTITQGTPIPLAELGFEAYIINVFVNDEYVGQMTINDENNGKEISIEIPEKFIIKGNNVVTLESDLWSPSDYGRADKRQLGLAISKIEFTASDAEKQNE